MAPFDSLIDQSELNDLLLNWGSGVGADPLNGALALTGSAVSSGPIAGTEPAARPAVMLSGFDALAGSTGADPDAELPAPAFIDLLALVDGV